MDLDTGILEADLALNMFFNNRFTEAKDRMQPWSVKDKALKKYSTIFVSYSFQNKRKKENAGFFFKDDLSWIVMSKKKILNLYLSLFLKL